MLRNRADSDADAERFVQRVADHDEVWALRGPRGIAFCGSLEYDDADGDASPVLLFFSDRAYAARVQRAHFADHVPEAITLFDFMYRWLPGLSGDAALAGPNWTAGLTGCEVDPFELRGRITAAMAPERVARHRAVYESMVASGAG